MKYKYLILGILMGFTFSLLCNNKFLSWTQKKAWYQLGYANHIVLPPEKLGGDNETFISWSYGNYIKECVDIQQKDLKIKKISPEKKKELYEDCLRLLYYNMHIQDLNDYDLNISLTKDENKFKIDWGKLIKELWSKK